ncbi:EamA family transporter [Paenibacillus sp. GCM10023248]|uniref:EamA family transporter n=1 Tax=Bacillales TaxID=1385 RepID=UPI002378F94C|nr:MULTISPECIES: EamA family transporter [Bacillales]MDD9266880.1 EamA family transporter [Paenibacillus sp. MAHUQ-63]MDR6881079.1 drug/metabolite transporter (DMT)-like permease [Bacillus sp. 3255]
MVIVSILLVIASGLTHAIWSLFTKRSRNKSVFLWSILMVTTIILLPYLIRELWLHPLSLPSYGLLLLSAALQSIYALLLSRTYNMGDLSQIYPIMRGTSTLLIPIVGVLFLRESLSWFGWLGLLCMIAGFLSLSGIFSRRHANQAGEYGTVKPFLMALCVGLCTTCYVLVDKLNLQHISAISLLEVTNIGFVAALTPIVIASKQLKLEWKLNFRIILIGAILNPGSYLLFLFAMKYAPVAHISPIREIGTVFATILGIVILKEKQGRLRIICSILITIGILLIGIWG